MAITHSGNYYFKWGAKFKKYKKVFISLRNTIFALLFQKKESFILNKNVFQPTKHFTTSVSKPVQ